MAAAQYTVQRAYRAFSDGRQFGPWHAGEVVELEETVAEWVNRDSPGCLTPAAAKVDAAAPVDEPVRAKPPARDRQARGGRNRSGS